MTTLYKLADQYATFLSIVDSIMNSESELSEEDIQNLSETLDAIKGSMSDKIENIVKLMKNIEGDITAFKNEEERLKRERKIRENLYNRLKLYIYDSMNTANITKINAGLFKVFIQKSPPSVEIINEDLIPDHYKIAQKPKVDSRKLLDDLKSGKVIDGVKLVNDKTHVRIK